MLEDEAEVVMEIKGPNVLDDPLGVGTSPSSDGRSDAQFAGRSVDVNSADFDPVFCLSHTYRLPPPAEAARGADPAAPEGRGAKLSPG